MVFVVLIHRANHAALVRDSGKVNVVRDEDLLGRGEIHICKHLMVSRLYEFGFNSHHNNRINYHDKEVTTATTRGKKIAQQNSMY